jgi:hypothetical protein
LRILGQPCGFYLMDAPQAPADAIRRLSAIRLQASPPAIKSLSRAPLYLLQIITREIYRVVHK